MSQICSELHILARSLPRYRFPYNPVLIPHNGIYLLFERGETGHEGERIVRIGTHTGKNQLRARLEQHFISENKDRSIFRKNIGRALLNQTEDPFLAEWEIDRTSTATREKYGKGNEKERIKVEKMISSYLQSSMSFVVIPINERDDRLSLESRIISTVSLCEECGPSSHWLGKFSPKEKVRTSGLWLVNELYKVPLSLENLDSLKSITLCPIIK